jgi:hypothetical protein
MVRSVVGVEGGLGGDTDTQAAIISLHLTPLPALTRTLYVGCVRMQRTSMCKTNDTSVSPGECAHTWHHPSNEVCCLPMLTAALSATVITGVKKSFSPAQKFGSQEFWFISPL